MSENLKNQVPQLVVRSTRFGELEVPADSVITIPSGLIGFPRHQRFVMIDHKPPFSWLHSVDDPNLAFVVVDGFQFGERYSVKPPIGDRDTDLQEGDEYAILVVVTVRPNAADTTANLKAPIFVNIKNKRGVQIIFDDSRLSTRFPLWEAEEPGPGSGSEDSGQPKK
jgi:flagellar assembly factor FliW